MADSVLKFNFLVGKNEVPAAADKNAGALTKLASRTASFGKVAAVALGGAAVAAGGMAAAGVVMGVKTAASLEQAQIGFSTLLGSSRKAGDYLAKLKAFAAATPFELSGLVESSRSLLGVGVNANDAMKILQSFGDTASAVGIDQAAFQRIMVATSQAIGAGKFQTQDLNQIMNNGIPIWTILSRAMGKPIPEIRKLASSGKLLSSDVLPVLEKQMGKDYGGAMARQSQTLAGLWSTLMDTLNLGLASVLQPLLPTLKTLATDGINFLGAAFKALPAKIATAITWFGNVRDYVVKSVLPGIRGALGQVGDRLPRIDWGKVIGDAKGVAGRVAAVLLPASGAVLAAAQHWGGRILDGITAGLHAGNWGPLGKTLGDGLATALSGLATGGAKLVSAFSSWFSSIDWLAVGKTVGAQAFPFAIGFVNTLFDGLFTAVRQHPMDVALFIAAFIPVGKIASAFGPLRSAIEHLPLGSWFTWLLDHTAAPVFDAIRSFFGFIGKEFLDGVAKVFPFLRGGFGRLWSDISTEIGGRVLYFVADGKRLIGGLVNGMGQKFAAVLKGIGSLIGDILRPFARADKWLIGKGVDVVVGFARGALSVLSRIGGAASTVIRVLTFPFRLAGGWLTGRGTETMLGFQRGVLGMLGRLGSAIGSVISRVIGPFRRAASWLFNAGFNVLWGFLNGLKSMWNKVTGWVSGIASWIRDHKGPISLDARLLIPAGVAIMTGFYKGLQSGAGKAWSFVKSVGGKTVSELQSALGMGFTMPVSGGGNGTNMQIGQRMNAAMGWGGYWPQLAPLWNRESGWNTYAKNPSSGAYGIPQALPASKLAAAGSDWRTNPTTQIRWGLGYIGGHYGNPGNAWAHEQQYGWYDSGGIARGAGLIAKGPQPERVLSPRQTAAFERLVPMLGRGGGATTVVVQLQLTGHAVGFQDQVVEALRGAVRSGRVANAVLPGGR